MTSHCEMKSRFGSKIEKVVEDDDVHTSIQPPRRKTAIIDDSQINN